jgi:hypothetical protein
LSLSKKDIQTIIQLITSNQDTPEPLQVTAEKTLDDIPKILKSMSATAMKKQFGLNTLEYKFIGIKDFMTKHNIQSGSKYAPSLNYANKHIINEVIINSLPKAKRPSAIKKCIKTLQDKQKHPPKLLYGKHPTEKQISHINANLQTEIDRWG